MWSDVCRDAYLYEMGKEQDVGGGRPHVSPWGIPRLPHIIDIPCCYSSAAPSGTPARVFDESSTVLASHRVYIPPPSLSPSFSHHSHRILSISYYRHTALRRFFRSAHQHRISTDVCPPRGRTIPLPLRWALNTREHFVNEWKTRVRSSPPFLVRKTSRIPPVPVQTRRSRRTRLRDSHKLLRVPLSRRDRYLSLSRMLHEYGYLQYHRVLLFSGLFSFLALQFIRFAGLQCKTNRV